MTDSTGNIVGEQRYYLSPRRHLRCASTFGETRLATGSMYTDKLYTGQRQIAGLGIYHYQSRFYSPKLGRFLSADSLVPNPFNPQDFNRFTYVRNNPVRYIDPSGHVCSDPEDPTPTCDNSFLSTTKVGNKVVKGSGLDAGKPKMKKKADDKKNDPPSPVVSPDGGLPDPDAPVVNANPDPLDGGLEQQQPGGASGEEESCPSCIVTGGIILVAIGLIEIPIIFAGILAVILTGPAVIEPLVAVFLPTEIVLLNIALIAFQYIKQGQNRGPEDIDIDYLPVIHIVTDSNWEENYLK